MLSGFLHDNIIESIMLWYGFFNPQFLFHRLIFGHFINVHFFLQPINNDRLPNNSNTYCFYYLKKTIDR